MVEKGFNFGKRIDYNLPQLGKLALGNLSWKTQYKLTLTSAGQPGEPGSKKPDLSKAQVSPAANDAPSASSGSPSFGDDEMAAFERLRARYQETRDTWSEHELAHLRFLRWLHQSGRLDV